MPDPISPHFHIDRPTGWRPESVNLEIVGWLFAGDQTRCADIRARVDRRIYLGIYGLERPDTHQLFGGSEAALRTGFIQRIQIWRGAREIALDWHDGTQWREFFRTTLDSSSLPASAQKPPKILRAALVNQTLHYLYRHFHRAPWRVLCREVDLALQDILTATSDVGPADHFIGHIENPGYWVNVTYEKFRVTGWTFGVVIVVFRPASVWPRIPVASDPA